MPISYRDRVLAALPGTYIELMERAHASRATVYLHIKSMRAAGLVRIERWKRTEGRGGGYQPIFGLGAGKDARCALSRMTSKQYNKRYLKKLKQNDQLQDYIDRKCALGNARTAERRARRVGDPLVAALFGRINHG